MTEVRRKVAVLTVAELDKSGKRIERLEGDELVCEVVTRPLIIDNDAFARLEERFETVDKWQEELAARPFVAVPVTLAVVWNISEDEASARMLPGSFEETATAIQRAILFYYGRSAEEVAKVEAAWKAATANLDTALEEILSTGEAATAPGSPPPGEPARPKSSGNSLSTKRS